ncbi:MAG: hypothetical protein K6360_04960 [Deltaproteobacteria bacterium]
MTKDRKTTLRILYKAALLVAVVFLTIPCHVGAAVQSRKVVVLPFNSAGAGEYSYLGPALEEILASSISRSEGISLVSLLPNETKSSSGPLDLIERANADYGLAGSVSRRGEGAEVTLFVIGKESPVPVMSMTAPNDNMDGLIPFVESFAARAADVIKKSAKQEPIVAESERPTLLAPVPGDEGPDAARMHPDRMFRSGRAAPSGGDVLAGPGGKEAGWTVQETWPEGAPRPTIGDGGHAGAPTGPEGGQGAGGSVPDFPAPGVRQVLVSSVPPRQESPGLLARLLPGRGGKGSPMPGSGSYGGLPYPSPEDLEAASRGGATAPTSPAAVSPGYGGETTQQGAAPSAAPPVLSIPEPSRPSPPEHTSVLPPPSQPQPERRGWLSRLFSPGKGDKTTTKAAVEQAVPPAPEPSKAPSGGGGAGGPIWQWY